MKALEAIAAAYGLTAEWGNSAHLVQGGRGIASVHDTALENELTVNPDFARGRELFLELAQALIGIVPVGPVDWLPIGEAGRDSTLSSGARRD